jgi:hypothetical protein
VTPNCMSPILTDLVQSIVDGERERERLAA